MIQQLTETARKEEKLMLVGYVPSDEPSAPIFEHLVTGLNWFAPQPFIVRYHHDVYALNPPWFEHIPVLPKGFEEFPWSELTPKEERSILRRSNIIPSTVMPFGKDRARVELINSIGLRFEREVIGWMITHRLANELIRYSALYIDHQFRHKGLSIRLVVNAIKKQQDSPIQWGYYEIMEQESLPSWKRFVQRRIVPYVQKVTRVNMVWKNLTLS